MPAPEAQLVPSGTALFRQLPELHESVVHSFESLHEVQVAPFLPQSAGLLVPGWQPATVSEQPVQHAPRLHLPAPL